VPATHAVLVKLLLVFQDESRDQGHARSFRAWVAVTSTAMTAWSEVEGFDFTRSKHALEFPHTLHTNPET
jgi:hypothetical protein